MAAVDGLGPGAADRMREIVSVAARMFEDAGYAQTSMADIAEAVSLRKPTLYHYFNSKAEILYRIHDEFFSSLTARLDEHQARGLRGVSLLHAVAYDIIDTIANRRDFVRVFFENRRELDESRVAEMSRRRDRYFETVRDAVRDGVRDGDLRMVDPDLAALAFFGMLNWAYQWFDADGGWTPEDVHAQLMEIFFAGVGVRPG